MQLFNIQGTLLGAQAARLHENGQETHAVAFQPTLVGCVRETGSLTHPRVTSAEEDTPGSAGGSPA